MKNQENLEIITYFYNLKTNFIGQELKISGNTFNKTYICESIDISIKKDWDKGFGSLIFQIVLMLQLKDEFNYYITESVILANHELKMNISTCDVRQHPISLGKSSISDIDQFIKNNFNEKERKEIYLTPELGQLIEANFNKSFNNYHEVKTRNLVNDIIVSNNDVLSGFFYDSGHLNYHLTHNKTIKTFDASLDISVVLGRLSSSIE